MRKNKLLLLLALLLTAATGAWATDVYVVGNGTGNWLNGVAWDPGAAGNKMTEQNGVYSITFNDVDANSDLQFKFAINGSWDVNYGCTSWDANELNKTLSNIEAGGANFKFGLTEKADVTISFNLSELTYMISTKGMKVGDDAATGYTVSMKDNVKDAGKWTVKVGEGQAQALPIGGLKGDGSETVTLQYTGRLKVKGVKATSEAAEASVPDGALSGKFSVSATKQVNFSKGNLRYESSKWSFFDNQYDRYTSYSADAWDHFGWSTSTTTYGMSTSTSIIGDYSGDFVDWGATMGTGWFTLSKDEWKYLFNTRSASTVGGTANGRYAKAKVNDVKGVILFPDTYTHPDGVNAPTGVNATGNTGWNGNSYTVADWTKMESAGCVFLPAAGYRGGSEMVSPATLGYYWSATPSSTINTYSVYFSSSSLNPVYSNSRYLGYSVRLVQEATSGEPAKPAATVTTAPTGAAIVGVGKETKLVSGGVADGGTLMYAVTTTNTKPASTDGFSEAVPTAQGITASGKVYVWYYVKADDTHSDSEIAATAIEVTVMAVPITVTWNPSDIVPKSLSDKSFTKDGITFTAATCDFQVLTFGGGGTFTTTLGNFTKIEISADFTGNVSGTGWTNDGWQSATWTGNAASVSFSGDIWGGGMTCEGGNLKIVFTIE